MAERLPPIRIEQRKWRNRFIEGLARWHRKAEVQNVENIARIEDLLDQGIPVIFISNHLSNLDAPLIATEIKKVSPRLWALISEVMGEVLWKNHLTRFFIYA